LTKYFEKSANASRKHWSKASEGGTSKSLCGYADTCEFPFPLDGKSGKHLPTDSHVGWVRVYLVVPMDLVILFQDVARSHSILNIVLNLETIVTMFSIKQVIDL
jgi:hypothetical protein